MPIIDTFRPVIYMEDFSVLPMNVPYKGQSLEFVILNPNLLPTKCGRSLFFVFFFRRSRTDSRRTPCSDINPGGIR